VRIAKGREGKKSFSRKGKKKKPFFAIARSSSEIPGDGNCAGKGGGKKKISRPGGKTPLPAPKRGEKRVQGRKEDGVCPLQKCWFAG